MRWMMLVAVLSVGLSMLAVGPAAAGAEGVQFTVSGQLPEFPCPDGCEATFSGSGTGNGDVATRIDGVPHVAAFAYVEDSISGTVAYTEPGPPFCPLIGFAATPTTASVELTGDATGTIVRTDPLLPTGTVTGITMTVDVSYKRVGVAPVIEITGGSVTVDYFFPSHQFDEEGFKVFGSFTESIEAGAGSGVFQVDPVQAVSNCQNPGELDFTLDGVAGIATRS